MSSVSLYLMNRKGVAVLDAILSRFGARAVRRVVGSRDHAVVKDYFDDIRALAESAGIAYFERLEASAPSLDETCIAVGWRWIINGARTLIVLHDSLLPRYRGFSPLVSCLINQEARIGVTALIGGASYDEGDIVAQDAVDVSYPIKVAEAIDLLVPICARLAGDLVARVASGEILKGRAQDRQAATYSLWRDNDDYRIDWTWDAQRIRRFIDAVGDPYRGASSLIDGRLVRIVDAVERSDVVIENRSPGKVIFIEDGLPVVVCGKGLLTIVHIKDNAEQSLLPLTKFRTRFV